MLVHRLRDSELGSDAVGRCGEQRLLVITLEGEQAGETTEATHDLGAAGLLGQRGEEFHRPVACGDIDSCCRVGGACGAVTVLGHRVTTPALYFSRARIARAQVSGLAM